MQIGMIGLGRMGLNMVKRLMTGGHRGVAYKWIMLPKGTPVNGPMEQFRGLLSTEDRVIDGVNTHYKADLRKQAFLFERGISLWWMWASAGASGGE